MEAGGCWQQAPRVTGFPLSVSLFPSPSPSPSPYLAGSVLWPGSTGSPLSVFRYPFLFFPRLRPRPRLRPISRGQSPGRVVPVLRYPLNVSLFPLPLPFRYPFLFSPRLRPCPRLRPISRGQSSGRVVPVLRYPLNVSLFPLALALALAFALSRGVSPNSPAPARPHPTPLPPQRPSTGTVWRVGGAGECNSCKGADIRVLRSLICSGSATVPAPSG
jgi:hypothetical protein